MPDCISAAKQYSFQRWASESEQSFCGFAEQAYCGVVFFFFKLFVNKSLFWIITWRGFKETLGVGGGVLREKAVLIVWRLQQGVHFSCPFRSVFLLEVISEWDHGLSLLLEFLTTSVFFSPHFLRNMSWCRTFIKQAGLWKKRNILFMQSSMIYQLLFLFFRFCLYIFFFDCALVWARMVCL